jgi:hypothetical protein
MINRGGVGGGGGGPQGVAATVEGRQAVIENQLQAAVLAQFRMEQLQRENHTQVQVRNICVMFF